MHYRQRLDKHILPSLGALELRSVRPETIAVGVADMFPTRGPQIPIVVPAGDSPERRACRWRIAAPSVTHAAPSATICSEVIGKCGELTRRATMPLNGTLMIGGS
jgi:hypothetical protein